MRGTFKILGSFVSLVLMLSACPEPKPASLSDAQRVAIADSLRQFARVFEQGINALDVDRQLRLFSADADMTWANDGQIIIMPRDSLGALYRSIYKGFRKMDFAWDTMRVAVLGPDAGVLTGAGHYAVTDTAGKTLRQGVVGTYVFVRRNGTWQLLHGHASHRPVQ